MNKATILLAAMTVVALGATDARASDTKTMSALTCTRRAGGTGSVDPMGRFQNEGASEMEAMCPILRDSPLGAMSVLKVWVLDVNPTSNVWCRTASLSRLTTNTIAWGAKDFSMGSNFNEYQRLDLDIPMPIDYGAYILECGVPQPDESLGSSKIVSWYYDET